MLGVETQACSVTKQMLQTLYLLFVKIESTTTTLRSLYDCGDIKTAPLHCWLWSVEKLKHLRADLRKVRWQEWTHLRHLKVRGSHRAIKKNSFGKDLCSLVFCEWNKAVLGKGDEECILCACHGYVMCCCRSIACGQDMALSKNVWTCVKRGRMRKRKKRKGNGIETERGERERERERSIKRERGIDGGREEDRERERERETERERER